MKTIKVAEATELQLNWLVAKCVNPAHGMVRTHQDNKDQWHVTLHGERGNYAPSTDWAQGGPIIERIKGLEFKHWLESKPESCCEVHIHNYEGDWVAFGPTPLIAAMRCYVASKLGDTVGVPEELT